MTSLATQLKKLATPQTDLFDHRRKRASVLFDAAKAERITTDTCYEIGLTGFQGLVETNPAFSEFAVSLFGKNVIRYQRSVQSKDANIQLDKTIERFCLLLSPYLEKQSALQALEWLIYRFMVHEMNIDSLMMCILPYYETVLFVRILQIIDIRHETSVWYWLRGYQKSNRPLVKRAVFNRWAHSQAFRLFMVNYLKKILKVHGTSTNVKLGIALYVSTVVGGMSVVDKITEEQLSSISLSLHRCVRSPHRELVSGGYLIIAQLLTKGALSQTFLHNLITKLCQNAKEDLAEQCTLCIVAICHHQQVKSFQESMVKSLTKEKHFILNHVVALSSKKDVTPFITAYISGYIALLLNEDNKGSRFIKGVTEIIQLIESMSLTPTAVFSTIRCLIGSAATYKEKITSKKLKKFALLLQSLSRCHPEGYDKAISELTNISFRKNLDEAAFFKKIMFLMVGKTENSTFLNLVHPLDEIRIAAATTFCHNIKKRKVEHHEGRGHILTMLRDTIEDIVVVGLNAELLAKFLGPQVALEECKRLINHRVDESKKLRNKINRKCFRILVDSYADENCQDFEVIFMCFSTLMCSHDKKLHEIIFNSFLCKQNDFLYAVKSKYLALSAAEGAAQEREVVLWRALPEAISQTDPAVRAKFINFIQESLTTNDTAKLHFILLICLQAIMEGSEDHANKLKAAHRLADACLKSLASDGFEVVPSKEESNSCLQNASKLYKSWLNSVKSEVMPLALIAHCLTSVLSQFILDETGTLPHFCMPFSPKVYVEDDPLLLLVKVLKAALMCEGNSGESLRNTILHIIFKEKIVKLKKQLYFLAMLWGWQALLPYSELVDETVQVWSYHFGKALMESTEGSLSWTLDSKEPLIPSVMSGLCCGSRSVRNGAMKCLAYFSEVSDEGKNKFSQSALVKAIIARKEAVLDDVSQIPVAVSLAADRGSSGKNIVQCLIDLITDNGVPPHIKTSLLYCLSEASGKNMVVLKSLLPMGNALLDQIAALDKTEKLDPFNSICIYYILQHFKPKTAQLLKTEEGWQFFARSLQSSQNVLCINEEVTSVQRIMRDQLVCQEFFSIMENNDLQAKVLSHLINCTAQTEDPREAAQLRVGLRKVSLDAALIAKDIEDLNLSTKVSSLDESKAKRQKIKELNEEEQSFLWHKLGLMLEIVEAMPKIRNPWLLIGPVCRCLHVSLTVNAPYMDSIHQQILSVLHTLLKSSSEQLPDLSTHVHLNVELIVQCIRSSGNPDTHRRALLILALAADYYPDMVLHNMMAIFTFMGTSLVRHDDMYSFQVINMTLSSIVPVLIKCGDQRMLIKKLAGVSQVFVDALPDIPEHRRLPLFTELAKTMGTADYLWLFMALITDSYITRGSKAEILSAGDDDKTKVPKTVSFILQLMSQFSVFDQIKACSDFLDYLIKLPEELRSDSPVRESFKQGIINWKTHTPKQLRHFKYTSVGMLVLFLSSDTFIRQVVEVAGSQAKNEAEALQSLYRKLLSKTLHFLQMVTEVQEKTKKLPSGQFWSAMQKKIMDLVEHINTLLPPAMLIDVIGGLLKSPMAPVQCLAMQLLSAKLHPNASFFSDNEVELLLPFLDHLRVVGASKEERVENRQTALYALQLLIRLLGEHVQQPVLLPALTSASQLISEQGTPVAVLAQSLMVVAETVSVLKTYSLEYLPQLVPVLLQLMVPPTSSDMSDHLLLAAVTAVHKLVENVPQFLSTQLVDLICAVCMLGTAQETNGVPKDSRLTLRLNAICDLLVISVEARILLPTLSKAYHRLLDEGILHLMMLMSIMENFLGKIEATILANQKQPFLDFFIHALELRTLKGSLAEVCRVEASVNVVLTRMLLRLNEHDNNDIFMRLHQWATDAVDDRPARLITFYRFTDHLAGALKVLFLKARLAEKIFKHTAVVLERNNKLNHHRTIFIHGNEKEKQACELVAYVIDTLNKIFLHDSVNFMDEERFHVIVQPLVDQLDNTIGGEEAYNNRIKNHLIPCVVNFVTAVGDDFLWKELNKQILQRIRGDDENNRVVLMALEMFKMIVEKHGENYLQPLIVDIMPPFTEVLETSDPEVEELARVVYLKMEEILGDSLRAYLDK